MKTLFLAENGVKLKNLTGYTTYMVSVAAFNAAGDGPPSSPTRGQTQQAGGQNGRSGERGSAGKGTRDHRPLALVGSGGGRLIPPAECLARRPGPMGCLPSGRHSPRVLLRREKPWREPPGLTPPHTHTCILPPTGNPHPARFCSCRSRWTFQISLASFLPRALAEHLPWVHTVLDAGPAAAKETDRDREGGRSDTAQRRVNPAGRQ